MFIDKFHIFDGKKDIKTCFFLWHQSINPWSKHHISSLVPSKIQLCWHCAWSFHAHWPGMTCNRAKLSLERNHLHPQSVPKKTQNRSKKDRTTGYVVHYYNYNYYCYHDNHVIIYYIYIISVSFARCFENGWLCCGNCLSVSPWVLWGSRWELGLVHLLFANVTFLREQT